MSALVISTDLDELVDLCDRIAVLFAGRLAGVVENGPGVEQRVGELMVGQAPPPDGRRMSRRERRPPKPAPRCASPCRGPAADRGPRPVGGIGAWPSRRALGGADPRSRCSPAGCCSLALGRDPFAFFRDISSGGVELVGLAGHHHADGAHPAHRGGLIVVFRASLWNLGGDGQYLLASAVIAGIGPEMLGTHPRLAAAS